MQGYQTIDSIVRETCFELDDNGMHNYVKFLKWGLDCVQELRLDSLQEIKSVDLTTSSLATIPFPVDMVKWTKIGVREGDRVKVFTMNNSIAFGNPVECGQEQPNSAYHPSYEINTEDERAALFGYWFGGYSSGAIFGYGQGVQGDGQFRVDLDKREFRFSSQYANRDIILEYVSSGINPSGETLVEESARQAIIEYIHWLRKERSDKYSLSDKDRSKFLYDEALRKVQRRALPDIDTIVASVRKGYKQTPKA
jgi:hypothetical protein